MNHAIAVKSCIVQENKLLLLKRRPTDVHSPGAWDIPGGRLAPGEHPHAGLQRETKEETHLDIVIHKPIAVDHFTRDDGQVITMLIFLCSASGEIVLSEEHSDYKWVPTDSEEIPNWLKRLSVF